MLRLTTDEARIQSSLAEDRTGDTPQLIVECYDEVSSTMDRARELSKKLLPGQIGLVRAQRQTAGRGREGRPWENAVEGFWGTFCFKVASGVDGARPQLSGLSLVVGLQVLDSCESFGCSLKVKWPNDIFSLDGKKLAGILIESTSSGASTSDFYYEVLIGIGINLRGAPLDHAICLDSLTTDSSAFNSQASNSSVPSAPQQDSSCNYPANPSHLPKEGANNTLHNLSVKLITRIEALRTTFFNTGFSAYREAWLNKGWCFNQEITIKRDGKAYKGIFTDLGPNGEMILETPDGLKSFVSGEVERTCQRGC